MNAWLDACQNVYKHLQDEMSRTIFLHRMNYSMTGEDAYLVDMIHMLPEGAQVYKIPKQPAYIFGAGSYGKKTKRFLPMEWIGFIDNDNQKRGGTAKVCPCSRWKMSRVMRRFSWRTGITMRKS